MGKKEIRDNMFKLLDELSLLEQIEMLSNIMILLSVQNIQLFKETNQVPTSWNECIEFIKKDVEVNGESIANALGKQAINMIWWLETLKK